MTREVAVTRGYVAIVDDEDYERVSAKKWVALISRPGDDCRPHHYWHDGSRIKWIGIGRLILDAPAGLIVDHINGDPLDNRRANLRLCTVAENNRNQRRHRDNNSGYKGVTRIRPGRWQARIFLGGTSRSRGVYSSPEAAARAYDAAAVAHYGEFARLNFPQDRQAA